MTTPAKKIVTVPLILGAVPEGFTGGVAAMADGIHPAAPHHLPPFITAPGETDYFYNGSAIFLVVMVIVLGTLYFRLHALPEHLAHGNENRLQFQLVGVLALLALFTHNNIFWVAALLLALIRIPDLATPLGAIADSLAKMAGWRKSAGAAEQTASVPTEDVVASRAASTHVESSRTADPAATGASSSPNTRAAADSGSAESPAGIETHPPAEPAVDRRRPALS